MWFGLSRNREDGRMTFTVNADLEVNGSINRYGEPLGGGAALPFSRYVALLTQEGINDPVVTVLENGLSGAVVWARLNTGIYTATLDGAFTESKTVVFIGGARVEADFSSNAFVLFASSWLSANVIRLYSLYFNTASPPAERADALLLKTEIEIRVYP